MTDFSIIQFEREFETQVALVKSSPWLVIKLKILNSLYSTVVHQLSTGQGKSYLAELDQLSVSVLRNAGLNEYSGIAPDLLDQFPERLQAQGPGLIQLEGINLISGLCCIYIRLNESARILKTLQKYNLYTGSDLKVDRQMSVEDFIPQIANHIPNGVRKALETELSGRQSASSGDSLWGLFVVGAADYTAGIVGRIKLMNVGLSKRLGTDQVRVASHLVDESDIIADQTRAVCTLLKQKYGVPEEQAIKLDYSIDQPAAVLIGNSIGLGLALLGSMGLHMYHHNRALEYRIYDDVAFTGAIDKTGQVQPVDERAIKDKIEATFFSRIDSVVLPVQQIELAQAALRELSSYYPNRQLNLILAESLPVLEQKREVIYLQRRRVVRRMVQFIREYANSVTLMIMGFIVLAVAGFWFGVVKHPMPVSTEKDGVDNTIKVINKYGYLIWKSQENATLSKIHDINLNGTPEVLITYNNIAKHKNKGKLVCYNSQGDILWVVDAGDAVKYGDTIYSDYFAFETLYIEDLDFDDIPEIFCYSSQGYFPNRFIVLSNKGELLSEYWNSGGLADVIAADIYPGNDNRELVISGRNNEDGSGILIVLDPFLSKGQSPQQKYHYKKNNTEAGNEIYHIKFPFTHFHEKGYRDMTGRLLISDKGEIRVQLFSEKYNKGAVYYTFNKFMDIIFTALDDNYFKT